MNRAIAAALLGLVAAGCSGSPDSEQEATPATTTTVAVTLGEDPTKPTTTTAPLVAKVAASLRAHGFQVTGVKKRDVEGGRPFGMTNSWDVHINGVEAGVNVFADTESLSAWLQTAGNLGAVVVFSTTDTWAITLDSDSDARAKSVKLAGEIGRGLYDDWQGSIRTIAR